MSHHGWVERCTEQEANDGIVSPFGRLLAREAHNYNSHSLSLLAGALGPLQSDGLPDEKRGLPTGFTFLGQFIDHDLTEFRVLDEDLALIERNPLIGQRQRVLQDGNPTTTNGRTSLLDLDSVYGLLKTEGFEPDLFVKNTKFLLREQKSGGTVIYDIERNVDFRDGRRIADPRNDENKLVVQIHLLFMRLHNKVIDQGSNFETAREQVRNAYRRIVLHDYLPRIARGDVIGKVIDRLKANDTFYQRMNRAVREALRPILSQLSGPDLDARLKGLVAMPVEFAHAAFRLGHAQLLNGYNVTGRGNTIIPLFITKPGQTLDLRGNEPITDETRMNFAQFFGPRATKGSGLDIRLAPAIFRLPPPTIGEPPISLAERNIRRGIDFGLPSGQGAAVAYDRLYGGVPVLGPDELFADTTFGPTGTGHYPGILDLEPSLASATPLWYYILAESQSKATNPNQDPQLGPVGSYIVAETLLGALLASSRDRKFDFLAEAESLRKNAGQNPDRSNQPNKVDSVDKISTMTDLLDFLGEDLSQGNSGKAD